MTLILIVLVILLLVGSGGVTYWGGDAYGRYGGVGLGFVLLLVVLLLLLSGVF